MTRLRQAIVVVDIELSIISARALGGVCFGDELRSGALDAVVQAVRLSSCV